MSTQSSAEGEDPKSPPRKSIDSAGTTYSENAPVVLQVEVQGRRTQTRTKVLSDSTDDVHDALLAFRKKRASQYANNEKLDDEKEKEASLAQSVLEYQSGVDETFLDTMTSRSRVPSCKNITVDDEKWKGVCVQRIRCLLQILSRADDILDEHEEDELFVEDIINILKGEIDGFDAVHEKIVELFLDFEPVDRYEHLKGAMANIESQVTALDDIHKDYIASRSRNESAAASSNDESATAAKQGPPAENEEAFYSEKNRLLNIAANRQAEDAATKRTEDTTSTITPARRAEVAPVVVTKTGTRKRKHQSTQQSGEADSTVTGLKHSRSTSPLAKQAQASGSTKPPMPSGSSTKPASGKAKRKRSDEKQGQDPVPTKPTKPHSNALRRQTRSTRPGLTADTFRPMFLEMAAMGFPRNMPTWLPLLVGNQTEGWDEQSIRSRYNDMQHPNHSSRPAQTYFDNARIVIKKGGQTLFGTIMQWKRDGDTDKNGGTFYYALDEDMKKGVHKLHTLKLQPFLKALDYYEDEKANDERPEHGYDDGAVISRKSTFTLNGIPVEVPPGAPEVPQDFRDNHRMLLIPQKNKKRCAGTRCGNQNATSRGMWGNWRCANSNCENGKTKMYCHDSTGRMCVYNHICEAYKKSGDVGRKWIAEYEAWEKARDMSNKKM